MEEAGYEIKHGKHLAFRLNGDKKFIRCRDYSLGEDYTEEAIKERILGKRNSPKQKQESKDKIDLLIDIQEKIKAGKGAFSALNTKKLPTIKELSKEYEKLLTEKKNLYSDYRKKKKEMQEILTVKSNVDRLLFPPQKEQPERENER